MAKNKRYDVYFYVAMVLLLALVGLSLWSRIRAFDEATLGYVQAARVVMAVAFVVLLLLSFRHPLRRMNRSLFQERRELERTKRRKKARH